MASLTEWFGRLHPIVIHFPIALACVAALAEAVRWRRDSEFLGKAVAWAAFLAGTSAVLAAGTGWVLAAHEQIRSDQRIFLEWHRWLGVAGVVAAIASAGAAVAWRDASRGWQRWSGSLLVWAAAALIGIGSHMGASIVWGRDWLF